METEETDSYRYHEATLSMIVNRVGSFVQGIPTTRLSLLQRIDELRKAEAECLAQAEISKKKQPNTMKHTEDLARFLHLVRARLEKGSEVYGDASIERPTQDLLGEIVEELADVAGWAAVLAARIFALQRKAKMISGTE
jgi:hypothetical protein